MMIYGKEDIFRLCTQCEGIRSRITQQTTPGIQLEGLWLSAMGFNPGDKIIVAAKKGKILVRLADDEYDYASNAEEQF